MTKFAWTVLPLLVLFSQPTWGGSLSFSTDFDGIGNGSGFTINVPNIGSSSHGPSTYSPLGGRDSFDSSAVDSEFLRKRYDEQLREAKKHAEEAEMRRQIERAERERKLEELQRLLERLQQLESDEPSVIQRMVYTQKVLDLEKRFDQARTEYMASLPSYRERLNWSIDHIVVPPPAHPLHYRHILIWGLWNTPEEAKQAAKNGEKDPFDGKLFDDVFAFGTKGPLDLNRVSLDHLLGQLERLSPQTASRLGQLKGAIADEVVCHSNGCRIAEVLIATGMLKVERLRILGGDAALMDLDYLKTLQEEMGLKEVSVYVIREDPVPIIGLGWQIMNLTLQIGHTLQTFQGKKDNLLYQVLGLTENPRFDPDAKFQVHLLSFPAVSDLHPLDKHPYKNYARSINGWRLTKCLNEDGTMSQHCIIY